jgi:hypothetical protein
MFIGDAGIGIFFGVSRTEILFRSSSQLSMIGRSNLASEDSPKEERPEVPLLLRVMIAMIFATENNCGGKAVRKADKALKGHP